MCASLTYEASVPKALLVIVYTERLLRQLREVLKGRAHYTRWEINPGVASINERCQVP